MKKQKLISSQAGFHAKGFQLQEKEKEQKMTAISGQKCLRLSKQSGQIGLLLKMLLESQVWVSQIVKLRWKAKRIFSEKVILYTNKDNNSFLTESSQILKQVDILSKHLLFQLVPSMPRTDETGFGLWPTPVSSEGPGGKNVIKLTDVIEGKRYTHKGDQRKMDGSLNPQWVEWLMGFPIGWTDLSV